MVRDFNCFFTRSKDEIRKKRKATLDLLGACSLQHHAVIYRGRGERMMTLGEPGEDQSIW
jgi:hypothetical protein